MTDLERLIGLARVTRAAFERVVGSGSTLCGYCYEASCFLRRLAVAHGIQTELGQGQGHWFVLHGDVVVDVTATQFGVSAKVVVLPLEEAKEKGDWWKLSGRHADPPPVPGLCQQRAAKVLTELEDEQNEVDHEALSQRGQPV